MGIGAAITSVAAAISSAFAGIGGTIAGGLGLADATLGGISAGGLIGGGLEGATIGAGLGGVENAVSGKPIFSGLGLDALAGGITGGLGPAVGGLTGLGTIGGDALAGAAGGALTSGISGGNALTGALTGGAGGAISGALSTAGTPDAGSASAGGGTSAVSSSPDFTVGGGAAPSIPDLTGDSNLGGAAGLGSTADAFAGPVSGTSGLTAPVDPALTFASSSGPVDSSITPPADATTPVFDATTGAPISGPSIQPYSGYVSTSPTVNTLLGNGASASDLIDAQGNYILPPTAPPTDGIVSPSTGAIVSPGDPSFSEAAHALNAPVAAPANAGSSGGLNGIAQSLGLSNGGQLAALGLAGGGLLYNLSKSNSIPGESAISSEATTAANESTQLQNYVTSGTLPPGVSTVLNQVQGQMQAQIKAKYASLGMSGSTAETQDLNNAQVTVQAQGAQEALNLMNQGVSLANLSGQLLTTLLSSNTQQAQQTSQSIGQLAAALAGGGQTIKVTAA